MTEAAAWIRQDRPKHVETTPVANDRSDGDVILRVEGLKTYFFQRKAVLKAVDGVNFTVRKGEAVGLVGESGSGKTMTCLSIMRLMPGSGARIVEGKVWFGDEDLLSLSEQEMRRYRGRRMAMIMQDPQTSLNPVYTVGEQLAEPVRLHLKERGQSRHASGSWRRCAPWGCRCRNCVSASIPISSAAACANAWSPRWG